MAEKQIQLTYQLILDALAARHPAIRFFGKLVSQEKTHYVTPPVYEKGQYVTADTIAPDGTPTKMVRLNSVQAEGNAVEAEYLAMIDAGVTQIPHLAIDFTGCGLKFDTLTTLQLPHRTADAILRDSLIDGVPFRLSPHGKAFEASGPDNATWLLCNDILALIFGVWPSIAMGHAVEVKFGRSISGEILGYGWRPARHAAGRKDPLGHGGMQIFHSDDLAATEGVPWTADPTQGSTPWSKPKNPNKGDAKPAKGKKKKDDADAAASDDAKEGGGKGKDKGKGSKSANIGHGDIVPAFQPYGGGWIEYAVYSGTISLAGLSQLHFPRNGERKPGPLASREEKAQWAKVMAARDTAARAAIVAIGLLGLTARIARGFAHRQRFNLIQVAPGIVCELVRHGAEPIQIALDVPTCIRVWEQAVEAAREVGLDMRDQPIMCTPSQVLLNHTRRAAELKHDEVSEGDSSNEETGSHENEGDSEGEDE